MTEADLLSALTEHWLTQYDLPGKVFWEDDETQGGPTESWMRVSIRSAGTVRPIVGRSMEQHRGTITVQMFSPREGGPGQIERDASIVAQIWRDFRHERLRLDAPSVVSLPAEGAFIRRLVTLGWRGDMRF